MHANRFREGWHRYDRCPDRRKRDGFARRRRLQLGVYYDNTTSGNVTGATIFGANYFGVVVIGDVGTVSANVTGSTVHDIGETPLNGSQHGTAIYYRALGAGTASGTISGNTITHYQKGGSTANGSVSATITKNTVAGEGAVGYIAQNGIQVGYGAKATVTGNVVSGNAYTGTNLASSGGILVVGGECFGSGLAYTVGLDISKNTLTNNDVGVWLFNADAACNAPSTKTNNSVKFNTVTNDAVTTPRDSAPPAATRPGSLMWGTRTRSSTTRSAASGTRRRQAGTAPAHRPPSSASSMRTRRPGASAATSNATAARNSASIVRPTTANGRSWGG
jgi:hypothetical protein